VAAKYRVALKLVLQGPASPARVAMAARAMDEILRATEPDLVDDDITMVVDNWQLKAEIRTWSAIGQRAATTTSAILSRPDKFVTDRVGGRQIAQKIAAPLKRLAQDHARITKPPAPSKDGKVHKPDTAVREVTLDFAQRIEKLAAPVEVPRGLATLRGSDVVISPILRVGRKAQGTPIQARLVTAAGQPFDVEVPPACAASFYEAAKDGAICAITLDVVWRSQGGARMVADPQMAIARGLQRKPIVTAEAALAEFREAAPNAVEDVEDLLDNLRGD
jgi:hypothetical protein